MTRLSFMMSCANYFRIFFALLVLISNISFDCSWSRSSIYFVVVAAGTKTRTKTKIAIIGGGISGSFVTKYLTDYDNTNCGLDITIYDPYHTGIENENEDENENDVDEETQNIQNQQGSRVSSYILKDGTVVERGASILFSGNQLVNDMIDSSFDLDDDKHKLIRIQPHGSDAGSGGMAIYNGNGDGPSSDRFPILLTNNMTSNEKTTMLVWRYNIDLYKINSITDKTIEKFNRIYTDLLNNNNDNEVYKYLNSPNDIWNYIGLSDIATISFNDYLIKTLGISTSTSTSTWYNIRKYLLEVFGIKQGLVSNELYEPMNICNNNQNNKQITALAALVNSAASTGDLFAIQGGNDKLITSAFQQAVQNQIQYESFLYSSASSRIKRISKQVKILVSDDYKSKMELFGAYGKLLGIYDIVILATPLQFSGIEFLGKGSIFDSNALFDLPLNKDDPMKKDTTTNNSNQNQDQYHPNSLNNHNFLPSSATRSYTQVVTTFVSNGILNTSYFINRNDNENGNDLIKAELPVTQSILFTEYGKNETGISSIGRINSNTYKIFSTNEISIQQIENIFGLNATIEHVKVWGGSGSANGNGSNYTRGGGATPAFNMDGSGNGNGNGPSPSYSTQFLLYDGSNNGGRGGKHYGEDSALTDFDKAFPDDVGGSTTGTGTGGPVVVGPAIYYTNAMESAVSAIEISAIGSKVVSKLIARRLGLIGTNNNDHRNNNGDEL